MTGLATTAYWTTAPQLQAQAALSRVLEATGKTTNTFARGPLARAAAGLAPRLTPEQAQTAFGRVQSALGWSASAAEAREWVKVLVVLVARLPDPRSSTGVILEALKYPITGGGDATDQLLIALRKYFPKLPGPAAGLGANLDWLKLNEPSIDLTRPAVCPLPPRDQLHCPVAAASF
jgi:hypothetical protein